MVYIIKKKEKKTSTDYEIRVPLYLPYSKPLKKNDVSLYPNAIRSDSL